MNTHEDEYVCRNCKRNKFDLIFETDNVPISSQKLLKKRDLGKERLTDITLLICKECSLIQLPINSNAKAFYDDEYLCSFTHSPHAREYQSNLAKWLVDSYRLQGKLVLEIGCGDGYFLSCLQRNGMRIIGIEPSQKAISLAALDNCLVNKIINGFWDEKSASHIPALDIVVLRHVLEHMNEFITALNIIHDKLNDNGLLYIEVPNVNKILAENRFFEIYQEHLNYFSLETLSRCLERIGFRLLETRVEENEEFIIGIFKKEASHLQLTNHRPITIAQNDWKTFSTEWVNWKQSFLTMVNKEISLGKKIACFGAGGRGITLLAMCEISNDKICVIFDNDKNKHGMFTPGSHIEICSPDGIKTGYIDSIIILASTFEKEIFNELTQYVKMGGKVGSISPFPHWINN